MVQVQRKYDNEYKVQSVKLPQEIGGAKAAKELGVPTVTDRFIQQAIAQVLVPIYDKQFHDNSYGFRPNRCA